MEPVFGEIKWDGRKPSLDLRGSVKVRGEFSLLCLVHNVKKIVKRVLDGTVSLPGKYNRAEEAVLGYREKQFAVVGAEVYNQPRKSTKIAEGGDSFRKNNG